MRRLMTLGLISIGAACTVACGDDDPSFPGNGGSAGSNGNAGNAGDGGMSNGGNGGSPGNGGSSGNAGSPGNGGSSGADGGNGGDGGSAGDDTGDPDAGDGGGGPPCTGCVELRVPVTGINQAALFQFVFAPPADLTNAVVTFRLRTVTFLNQTHASPYSNDSTGFSFNNDFTSLTDSGTDFVDVVYDLSAIPAAPPLADAGDAGGADPGAFDKSSIGQLGIEVGSAGAYAGGETTIVVLLDEVTFEGDGVTVPDVTFDANDGGLAINGFAGTEAQREGAEVIHHPAD